MDSFLLILVCVTICVFLVLLYYEVAMTRNYLLIISSKLDDLVNVTRRLRDDIPLNGTGENDGKTPA